MEVGLVNNIKVGFIIQARMQSTRLPGKVLMPLPINGNKTILHWIVQSIKKSKYDHQIIIASSSNSENNVLESICTSENIFLFRGSEDDVLNRFITIAKSNRFDVIVRLTADNPFVDIRLLDELIEIHLRHDLSYTGSSNLPVGMNFEIVKPQSIIDLEKKELSSDDKEHVTTYIKNNYPIFIHEFISEESIRNVRLTIDYPSDYALVSLVASLLKEPTLKNIERIFKTYPWLKEINEGNFQKKSFKDLGSEINEATRILDLLDLYNASKILKEKLDN